MIPTFDLIHIKAAGYKINLQKSVVSPYTDNKLPKKEIKKTIPQRVNTWIQTEPKKQKTCILKTIKY